jgi:putative Ca2+/H+ antiporter (TMEM165/GDT1 family)
MAPFLFAFVAVALVSLGGRDQLLIARLAEKLGRGGPMLAVGVAASTISATLMAIAGLSLALILPEPAADMLVALALLLAGVELAWRSRAKLPDEPTRSLFAVFAVLLARQIGDAARFLVFAFAAGGPAWLAATGGAFGGAAALAVGWAAGADLDRAPLRAIRLVLAAIVALTAIVIALNARGIVG